ncbi:MAG: hypothetical protein CML43_18955 [Rhodobacteraceae bacterium]|nr:hypothetical protein [Paracoccaceae bacterium]
MRTLSTRARGGAFARAAFSVAAVLLVAAVALWAGPGHAQFSIFGLKNSLVQFLLKQISVEGEFELTATGIEEPEDGVTRLAGVQIADGDGVWFKAEGVDLNWNASRILRGELEIRKLAVVGMEVLRKPNPPEVTVNEDSEVGQATFDPFAWPRSPIATRVEEMRLERAFVAAGVLAPQSLSFEATGSFVDEGDEQSLTLDVTRTDDVVGEIDLNYVRDFSDESLTLKLDAGEAPGGLVAAMAGLPEGSASSFVIDASGPLTDWALTLKAEAERMIEVTGSATVNAQAPIGASLKLALVPGEALDPAAHVALGERAELDLVVQETEGGVIRIESGHFRSPSLGMDVSGDYVRDTAAMDFALKLEALAPLAALAEGVDFERFGFDGTLKGDAANFTAKGALTLAGLTTAPADLGGADLDVTVTMAEERVSLDAAGFAEQVRLDKLGPDLLGETRIDVKATYGLTDQQAALEVLSVASPLLEVSVTGDADLEGESAAVDYRLATPDLKPVAGAYGQDAGGRIEAEGRAEGPFDDLKITGKLAAEGLEYQGDAWGRVQFDHDVTVGPVIGGDLSLRAEGTPYGPAAIVTGFELDGDRLVLSDLGAEAMGATAQGGLRLDLATTLAQGDLQVTAEDLGRFSELAGQAMSGSMKGTLTLAPQEGMQNGALVAELVGFRGFGARAERADANISLRDALGAPGADFAISADGVLYVIPAEAAEATDGDAAAAPETRASMVRAEVTGAATDLTGAPAVIASGELTGLAVSGPADAAVEGVTFEADLHDLIAAPGGVFKAVATGLEAEGATLAELRLDATGDNLLDAAGTLVADIAASGLDAGGATAREVTAHVEASDLTGAPAATATAKVSGIDAGGATVRSAVLEASGRDLVAAPNGTAKLRIEGVDAAGAATFSRIDLTAEGGMDALKLALDARGETEAGEAVTVGVSGDGALVGEGATFRFGRLEAKAGDKGIAQRGALTLRQAGGAQSFDGINLELPGGALTGKVALRGGGLVGELALAVPDVSVPAALFEAPVTAGAGRLRADFDTRAGSPRADVAVDATGLMIRDVTEEADQALNVALRTDWNGRVLNADGQVTGGFGDALRVTAAIPLRPAGLVPAPPRGAQIDAGVTWKGEVETIWPLLPLSDHVLTGELDLDLRVGGTLDNPRPAGRVELTGGAYQNLEVGTILTDLRVSSSLRENGGGLLVKVDALDGAKGPVQAEIHLKGKEIEAALTTREAVLVRRDDVTAAITTDIRVEGPLTEPLVAGTVTVDRAEVRLVSATPPSLASLGEGEIKGAPPEEVEETPTGGPQLDVKVRAPGNIFVRGRGLQSEWEMSLDITGSAFAPAIAGAVERRRGTLDFLGREFDLVRGAVRFDGSTTIDPLIDVSLEHERDDITGRIAVRGYASDPSLAFESVPALPEDEVLPRVIFGRPRQSMTAAEALQLAGGVATLLSGGEGVLGQVRSAVGLDVLSVDTSGESTAVKAGRNVADGVFVGVNQPVDGGSTSVEVEVEVFENFTVEAETGADASAVGVGWKHDW